MGNSLSKNHKNYPCRAPSTKRNRQLAGFPTKAGMHAGLLCQIKANLPCRTFRYRAVACGFYRSIWIEYGDMYGDGDAKRKASYFVFTS